VRVGTERFSDRVDDYDRFRPNYPSAIIDAVLEGFDAPVVADIGAGTGISSHQCARAGARVFAIEPNDAMRAAIRPKPGIEVIAGRAEATTLAPQSVDVVAAFQAFHWFDRELALTEFTRIARRPGRFAAVWNHRDRDDAFTRAYDAIVAKHGERVNEIDRSRRASGVLDAFVQAGATSTRMLHVAHRQRLAWEELLGFVRSCSYLPRQGQAYEALERDLFGLFEREAQGGVVAISWIAEAHLGDRQ